MPAMKRYLHLWLWLTGALIVLVGVFNLVVDPYGIFGLVNRAGFNMVKPAAANQGAMFKAYQLLRQPPRTLIIGNSRAEVGFDPESASWPADAQPVFNAALPGTGTSTSLAYLRHVLAITENDPSARPTRVVWGIDFMDFLVDGRTPAGQTSPPRNGRLLVDAGDVASPGHWIQRARDYAEATLTLAATLDALETLRSQRDRYATRLTAQGFNPMQDYEKIAAEEGYWAIFHQRDVSNIKAYLQRPKDLYEQGRRSSESLDHLREVLALCHHHGIELKLVIYPYHARLLETMHITGHWEGFEEWRRAVVEVVAAASAGQFRPAQLWDFGGFNELTMETVPPKGDRRARMQWYWEAGHFKSTLGDRVLTRMFAGLADGSGIGLVVDAGNIVDQQTLLRSTKTMYEQRFPDDLRALKQIVDGNSRNLKLTR